jgi:hypothetical protein
MSSENKPYRGSTGRDLVVGATLMGAALIAALDRAPAHHSTAMYQENSIELDGVVLEFKYSNPHSIIILEVKAPHGSTVIWTLETYAPSRLLRDGWSSRTLWPGDAIRLKVNPLRSGAPGGFWEPWEINFRDGRPVAVPEPFVVPGAHNGR